MPPPAKPAFAAPAMTKPTAASLPPIFQTIGKVAKSLYSDAEGEVKAARDSGERPTGAWHPPTLQRAATNPADEWERRSGSPVDEGLEQLRKVSKEPIPDDLSKQEKGMLLMQLGFGIMAGGPGLAQALGQSGMAMMGTWHDLRRDKQRAGQAAKRDEMNIIGKQIDVAAGRENTAARAAQSQAEFEARQQLAREEMQGRQALSREEMAGRRALSEQELAGRMRLAEMDQNKPYTDVAKLNADLRAGRINQAQFDAAMAAGGTDNATTLMRDAKYVAQQFGMPEKDAINYLKMSAESRMNPDKTREDIFKIALGKTYGDAQEAAAVTEEAMRYLEGGPQQQAAPGGQPEAPSKGVMQIILEAAGLAGDGGQTATASEVTGSVPPAVGAIEDGYRFKGGDPSNPESWEPVTP